MTLDTFRPVAGGATIVIMKGSIVFELVVVSVFGSVLVVAGCKSSGGAIADGGGEGGTAAGGSQGGSAGSGGSTGTGGGAVAGASGLFAGVHAVQGTNGRAGKIVDKNGNVLVLHGADESGTENYCTTWGPPPIVISPQGGPSPLTQDSLTAMKSWGLNTVRIPLNEDCWLGINGVDASVGGANYQAPILAAVNLITQANGMYAILDLHWSAPGTTLPTGQGTMPDLDHTVTFWQQVAAAYKGNGSVIFDLFNEPVMSSGSNDQQFACWKNGSTAANGGDCPMVNFAVAGMQQLLTAVRGAGAEQPGHDGRHRLRVAARPLADVRPHRHAVAAQHRGELARLRRPGGCTADGATTVATLCGTSGLGGQAVMNAGYPIVVGETGYYSCSASVGQAWWPLFLQLGRRAGDRLRGLVLVGREQSPAAGEHDRRSIRAGSARPTSSTCSASAARRSTRRRAARFCPTTGCE